MNFLGLGLTVLLNDRASRGMDKIASRYFRLNEATTKFRVAFLKQVEAVVAGFTIMAVGAVGLKAVILDPLKAAAGLEAALIGVRKTAGLTASEVEELRKVFVKLSTQIPITAVDLAEIAEKAGQIGLKSTKDIEGFTKAVAQVALTSDLSAAAAADAFAVIRSALGLTIPEVENLTSVINELSNVSRRNVAFITKMTGEIAGSARIMGLTATETAALAAVLGELPSSMSATKTGFRRLVNELITDTDKFADAVGLQRGAFKQLVKESPFQAIQAFFEALGSLDQVRKIAVLGDLKLSSSRTKEAMLQLTNVVDKFPEFLRVAVEEQRKGTSITEELENVLGALNSQLTLLMNNLEAVKLTLGKTFLGTGTQVVKFLNLLLKEFNKLDPAVIRGIGIALALASAFFVLVGAFIVLVAGIAIVGPLLAGAWEVILVGIAVLAVLTLAVSALAAAWELDMGGIKTSTINMVDDVTIAFTALRDLFSQGFITNDQKSQLDERGLTGTVGTLFAILSRGAAIIEGFGESFSVAMPAIVAFVDAGLAPFLDLLKELGILSTSTSSSFSKLLLSFSIEDWREAGRVLGRNLAGGILLLQSAMLTMLTPLRKVLELLTSIVALTRGDFSGLSVLLSEAFKAPIPQGVPTPLTARAGESPITSAQVQSRQAREAAAALELQLKDRESEEGKKFVGTFNVNMDGRVIASALEEFAMGESDLSMAAGGA